MHQLELTVDQQNSWSTSSTNIWWVDQIMLFIVFLINRVDQLGVWFPCLFSVIHQNLLINSSTSWWLTKNLTKFDQLIDELTNNLTNHQKLTSWSSFCWSTRQPSTLIWWVVASLKTQLDFYEVNTVLVEDEDRPQMDHW